MEISKYGQQLLQALRGYKQAVLYREAYKVQLLQHGAEPSEAALQTSLNALQPVVDRKFLPAEQQLLDGKDPQAVLDNFLLPKE